MTDNFEGSDPTLEAVGKQMVLDNPPQQRVYLGASVIGQSCWRQLWYDFRWVKERVFDANTLYRFADGHASEEIWGLRFKRVPELTLWTEKPDGGQFGFVAMGGHFRGHIDGLIKPLEDSQHRYIWEHKAVNERKFKDFEKKKKQAGEGKALKEWDDTYYAQAQIYMGHMGLPRHYLTVSTAGSRDIASCVNEFSSKAFERLMEKARRIIFDVEPLERISPKPDYYLCNWCNFKDNCHGESIARVSCRTCAHVTPTEDGKWHCEFHKKNLSGKDQRSACPKHLFIPSLIPFAEVTDMSREDNTITYQTPGGATFVNAETNDWKARQFSSKDLQHLNLNLLENESDIFA